MELEKSGIEENMESEKKGIEGNMEAEQKSVSDPKTVPETSETGKLKKNFNFFGPATMLYALFYAFCMYRNGSGIAFPFFLAGSLLYFGFSMKKFGITLKKGSGFYMVSVMLLAISTFCTDDPRMIALNKTGIFLLMLSFLLKQFCHTEKWGPGKYFAAMVGLVFSSLGEMARPVSDGAAYCREHPSSEKRRLYYVLLGLVLTVPVFAVVLLLLGSADAVFRQLTNALFAGICFENILGVCFHIVFWYFAVYMLLANLCRRRIRDEVRDRRSGEPIPAIIMTSFLSLLYLVFSGIQILYLFLGKMQLPEGYTYAEYAREGFFQLLAVSVINLVIVLICLAYFRESRLLKGILTVMSLCTFIMIASSALRMVIYIRYYYLTFLRIIVLWALAVLFVLFLGVMIHIYRDGFELFRYGVAVVSVFYLALSFSHPDYWIARVNIANAPQTRQEAKAYWSGAKDWKTGEGDFFQSSAPYQDYRYLAGLSADAAPVLIPYLEKLEYDFRVLAVSREGAGQQCDAGENSEAGEWELRDYWDAAGYYSGESNLGRKRPEGFGYYYLYNLQQNCSDMGIRGFNLSRYVALKLICR